MAEAEKPHGPHEVARVFEGEDKAMEDAPREHSLPKHVEPG